MITYELIRRHRKNITITVKPEGMVVVTAPMRVSLKQIDEFVEQKATWIDSWVKQFEKERRERTDIVLDSKQVAEAKAKAYTILTARCLYFARKMGVSYHTIKVNGATKRWGSCSAKGTINFTYRLLFVSKSAQDYVVVHELAHLRELNHSAAFWSVVEEVLPDYKERRSTLREEQKKFHIIETK